VLTGVCAASGIWATHFVAMLAYKSAVPTAYDPALTAASLFIAILATTLGFAICAGGSRRAVVIGGAIIGLGISLMHFTGMRALLTEGHIEWDLAIAGTAVVFGMLIATAAALAFHALKGKTAIAAGAALLTMAICAMHFTAMGAAVTVPDPTIDISHGFSANASMMALAIAGLTVLVILAGLAAALIDHQTMVDNVGQIRELVDAASEGIVIAADGVIVNVNRRITELCGRPLERLVGANVSGDLLHDFDLEPSAAESPTKEALLQAGDGRSIPVEVVRRQFHTGVRGNEVYAIRDLTERHRNEARIAHMARNDALTDLPNRILLRERLEPALSGRREEKIALLCLDLDRFKAVNDTLGHPVGDVLLKQVAKRLLGCVRARDTVARIGGDEFVILHDAKDPTKEAAALASRLIEVIGAPYVVNGHQVTIGTSVGIAVPLDDDVTPESLLAQAEASSSSTISLSSTWSATRSAVSRRCCAGGIRAGARFRPANSFRSPRKLVLSCRSDTGSYARPRRKLCAGPSTSSSPSTCRRWSSRAIAFSSPCRLHWPRRVFRRTVSIWKSRSRCCCRKVKARSISYAGCAIWASACPWTTSAPAIPR
jgi:diguanylate cyclase (GGDEF)-like protein/PAS domain S-box-containing protein